MNTDTFDKCQLIRKIIMNNVAEVFVYKNPSDSIVAKQIRDLPDKIANMKGGADLFRIQPTDLTEAQMIHLGFAKWDDKTDMLLIPLWLLPFLAEEIEIECIDGERKVMNKSGIDSDNRFGLLAYGATPKRA